MSESQADIHAEYHRSQRWRDRLHKSVCHKSLDIPEDDGVNINQHGITGKHLIMLAGIVLTGLLGWRVMAPEVKRPDPPPTFPAVQEYEVSFWAKDGTEYEVEPLAGCDGELVEGPE